ncbi:hypothetical protein GQ457_09G025660 [Hibiscus cannabinus]
MENNFTSDFHCTNSGDKEISYANNSQLQKTIILRILPTLNDELRETLSKRLPASTFEMADLGCSSGPNIFLIISQVIDSIHGICQQAQFQVPEIRVFLNDLPGNDFNAIFQSELVKEADVDGFNLPLYKPWKGELYEIIEREGSFGVGRMEISEVDWVPRDKDDAEFQNGHYLSNIVRAASEQMISRHFGDAVTDSLFIKYATNVEDHLRHQNNGKLLNFLVSLTRK